MGFLEGAFLGAFSLAKKEKKEDEQTGVLCRPFVNGEKQAADRLNEAFGYGRNLKIPKNEALPGILHESFLEGKTLTPEEQALCKQAVEHAVEKLRVMDMMSTVEKIVVEDPPIPQRTFGGYYIPPQ